MKTLVLISGLGQRKSVFEPIKKQLKGYDIHTYEIQDFLVHDPLTYGYVYAALEQELEKLEKPMIIAGHSLGANLALNYACNHQCSVKKLILAGVNPYPPKSLLALQNVIFSFMPSSQFNKLHLSKKQVLDLCKSMKDYNVEDELYNLAVPCFILNGSKDKANRKSALKLKEILPIGHYKSVEGSSHELDDTYLEMILKEIH